MRNSQRNEGGAGELFRIGGKVALVTGGAKGIGEMVTRALVAQGARVYISSRDAERCRLLAEELSAEGGDCRALPADLSSLAGVEQLANALATHEEQLHILVNNSGRTWGAPLETFPETGWDKVMNLNLKAPFFLTQGLLPLLRKAASEGDPARIINIGSIDGLRASEMSNFSYAASKAALHHLTRHLARHLAPQISVNAIAPGPFDTAMLDPVRQQIELELLPQIPQRRLGQQDDIAGSVIYLSSRAGAHLTGSVVALDGGFSTCR